MISLGKGTAVMANDVHFSLEEASQRTSTRFRLDCGPQFFNLYRTKVTFAVTQVKV
jgi:hypothetical protein